MGSGPALWPAVLVSGVLLVACGGAPDLAGTYDCGEDVLTIRENGTFVVVGHDRALQGTYEVDGATISFAVEGSEPAEALVRSDGSITFVGAHEHRPGRPDVHSAQLCTRR